MMLIAAAIALLQGSPTTPPVGPGRLAGVGGPSTTATPAAPGPDDEKVVCRTEQETGSLMPGRKICHTKAQWNQMAVDARDTTNAITLNGNHAHGGSGG